MLNSYSWVGLINIIIFSDRKSHSSMTRFTIQWTLVMVHWTSNICKLLPGGKDPPPNWETSPTDSLLYFLFFNVFTDWLLRQGVSLYTSFILLIFFISFCGKKLVIRGQNIFFQIRLKKRDTPGGYHHLGAAPQKHFFPSKTLMIDIFGNY